MNAQTKFKASYACKLGALLVIGAFAGLAHAAPATADDAAMARYNKEKAVCMDGRSNQDRDTCLKEATNALDEARRNPVSTPDAATLQHNAVARCAQVKPEDQSDCRRLALGQGQTSGSVQAGGVIKEIVTVEPAAPVPAPR